MAKQQIAAPKGFHPPAQRTAILKFTNGDYAGAVVKCRLNGSVRFYLRLTRINEDLEDQAEMIRDFGNKCLEEWNVLDEGGNFEPANGEGMLNIDENFAMAIINGWLEARASVPAPLAQPSPDGSTSPAESTTTETASPNPQS